MPDWLLLAACSVLLLLAGTALFFFTVTRGALLWRRAVGGPPLESAHVYPIYSNLRLMRWVDYQPVIAAILLFQYDRLVSAITSGLRGNNFPGPPTFISPLPSTPPPPHSTSPTSSATN